MNDKLEAIAKIEAMIMLGDDGIIDYCTVNELTPESHSKDMEKYYGDTIACLTNDFYSHIKEQLEMGLELTQII